MNKRNWKIGGILLPVIIASLSGCAAHSYQRMDVEINKQTEASEPIIVLEPKPDIVIETKESQEETLPEETVGVSEEGMHLLFGGDVLLSSHVLGAYEKAGGIHGVVDENYRKIIQQSDFFMVNEEFPFSSRGTAAVDKEYTFRIPPEKVALFEEMGIDGVSLANNHSMDFGSDALLDSVETLDQAGILHTGAGENLEEAKKPVIYEKNGKRIGIIGATRVAPDWTWFAGKQQAGVLSSYDPKALLQEITEIKKTCDYVVVFIHWGVEKANLREDYQESLGRQYIDAGADLVVGSHPHVLQGIEFYQGKPIVYSLGNFVFGSVIPKTVLLQVTFDGEEPILTLVPGTSSGGFTRMLTEETARLSFFEYMESISTGISIDSHGQIQREE